MATLKKQNYRTPSNNESDDDDGHDNNTSDQDDVNESNVNETSTSSTDAVSDTCKSSHIIVINIFHCFYNRQKKY